MTILHCPIPQLVLAVIVTSCFAAEPEFDIKLASQGVGFLKTYCSRCHSDDQKYPGLDMANRATLLLPSDPSQKPFVVPGDSGKSRLWDALDTEYMPPENQPQPTADEKQEFKNWIEAGAHFPPETRI